MSFDHLGLTDQRLITQYRETVHLKRAINITLASSVDAEVMFQELLTERGLETAVGYNLDVIGWIVGAFRYVDDTIVIPFFGFDTALGAGTFGDDGVPATGEIFKSLGQADFLEGELDDAGLRQLIRARILHNTTEATIEDVIAVVLTLLPDVATVEIVESYPAEVLVKPSGILTDNEKAMLLNTEFIPIPAGVTLTFEDDAGPF